MKDEQEGIFNFARNTRVTRLTAIVLAVLALALLLISAYSYLAAREVQEKYNTMVSDSLHKLELINSLHNNEDQIYNATIKHLQTTDTATMVELEKRIMQFNANVMADLEALNQKLSHPSRKQTIQNYMKSRQQYTALLQNILRLSSENQNDEAITLEGQRLLPAHHQHQSYLNELSDSISVTTRERGEQALQTINNTMRSYNLLLLAAILVTAVASYFIRRVLRQLRYHDVILKSEIREREQLRHALNESQSVYRSLFRNIALPMWVFDQDTFQILEVNKAAEEEYGYTRQEFLKMSIADLQPENQREKLREVLANLDGKLPPLPGWKHQRKDGSQFYVDVKSHLLPTNGPIRPRVVVAINIDRRVLAIQALEWRERQLREISASIPGVVFQFQLDGDLNYSFPFISEGIERLFHIKLEEVKINPKVIFDTVHPDELELLWETIKEAYDEVKPWEFEFRAWQKDEQKYKWLHGHSLPNHKQDSVVTWNGTLIDITSQKEAQEKLVASEANLRYLLNSSPQAIYLLDDQLHIIAFNTRAAEEVSFLQLKKLQAGESILNYIASGLLDETKDYHRKALQGETTVYETNNGGGWYEVAYRPVFGPENRVLAVALSIEDITEQKLILETIKHSEEQLARAQELNHMGSWEYELASGRITWSDNLYKLLEVDKETTTLTPTFIRRFIHPADAELEAKTYRESIQTGKPVILEHRVITATGKERVFLQNGEIIKDADGRPVSISGAMQDITEQKRAEQEITEARNLLQSVLANIPEIIFSTDAKFNVTYISPQCMEILGYPAEELTGNADLWYKNIHPDDLPKLKQVIQRLMAEERVQYEIRIIRRDGQVRWLLLRLSSTLDANGRLIRLDGSAADMTQAKMAEAKREDLNRQLVNQNRNLQQFAYIVSHNLRAPIANILGLTSIYNKTDPGAPINERVIDNLFKSARLLDNTIRDLNELLTVRSEYLEGMLEEIYFDAKLQHITDSLADEIEQSGAIITSDFSEAPSVVTIRSYLQSILHNLISNAIKYRDPKRILTIKLKSFVVDNYICLQISDNGLGIDMAKEKDKIFGLYKRFHPGIAGKGLGLHLVKTQAELLGGKVEVDSSVGVGTTFSVYFLKSSVVHEHIKKSNVD
ncbi:PAS domain S-box protein [Pontibacter sp. Tf4]|uniref:PAS domain S-box protein n=1 Tax=Pontibacter sp. Tf4 TaxID=2761620 RepID=UPI0016256BC6|nr:PAS domain S-box protein [Pontibacter sp. Tf4]MBB6610738.1 PAS domain S-box protein [Pontibacter sp. Tf4]